MNFTMYTRFGKMVSEEGIEKTAEFAVKHGFSGVEMLNNFDGSVPDPFRNVKEAAAARSVLDNYCLSVDCYSVACNLMGGEKVIDYVKEKIDVAAELGCQYLHHTLLVGVKRGTRSDDFQEKITVSVEGAEKIANYADTLGITCIYEEQGYYVNGVKGFGAFFSEMKKRCKNIGVCADMGNILFVGERPEDFLKEYVSDVKHVHLKDFLHKKSSESPGKYWYYQSENNWIRDTMIGHGIVDFEACLQIIKESGYKGAFALELDHPEPFDAGIAQGMEYASRIYDRI